MATAAMAGVTATIGVICLAGRLHEHFFFGTARWWEPLLLIVAALVLIKPGWATDLVGVVLIGITVLSQLMIRRGTAASAPLERT